MISMNGMIGIIGKNDIGKAMRDKSLEEEWTLDRKNWNRLLYIFDGI